jgi:hypothetical protein
LWWLFVINSAGIGLLSTYDREEFVVADLMILPKEYSIASCDDDDYTSTEAGLCLFRSSCPGGGLEGHKATDSQ